MQVGGHRKDAVITGTADFYAVLGVSRDASQSDVKSAYRKLAREMHPDLQAGRPRSSARGADADFALVNDAYRVLRDPALRQEYDEMLASEECRSNDDLDQEGDPLLLFMGGWSSLLLMHLERVRVDVDASNLLLRVAFASLVGAANRLPDALPLSEVDDALGYQLTKLTFERALTTTTATSQSRLLLLAHGQMCQYFRDRLTAGTIRSLDSKVRPLGPESTTAGRGAPAPAPAAPKRNQYGTPAPGAASGTSGSGWAKPSPWKWLGGAAMVSLLVLKAMSAIVVTDSAAASPTTESAAPSPPSVEADSTGPNQESSSAEQGVRRASSYAPLHLGMCLRAPRDLDSAQVCDIEYSEHRVFYSAMTDGDAWPGHANLAARAESICDEKYGRGAASQYWYFVPSQASWTDGDRVITCVR